MKFKKILNLALCLVVGASLAGCTSTNTSEEKNSEDKKIVVGATQVPGGDLFEHLRSSIEEQGYELEIKIFNDFITPNTALAEGDIDANLFQHKPFLEETVESKGYDLTSAVGLYEAPLLVYSYKIESLNELKSGDKFAVPNDPTNGSRALQYLQEEGIIKLNDEKLPGIKDIIENPKGIEFIEAEAPQLASLLPDVTAAFINGSFAITAGLDANKDSIYTPNIDGTFANILACRTEDKDSEKIEILKKALTSNDSKKFLEENYKGVIIPVF